MMKSIVVYFSLEGNSKYVADKIKEYTGADELSLKPVKDYPNGEKSKFFWGGKSAVFGEKPKLVPCDFDPDKYDLIIIGTPVWAGRFAPPVKTFISENDLSKKKIALFACSASGNAEKCFALMKKALPVCDVAAELSLVNPGKKQLQEDDQKIKKFCESIR